MKTLTTTQKSIMIFVTIIGYHFLISEIRNKFTNPKYILWINIASLVILVAAVLLSLHLKEKSENKPNYKIYFYYSILPDVEKSQCSVSYSQMHKPKFDDELLYFSDPKHLKS